MYRVKQGQVGNDPPYTVAYGHAPKFGGLLALKMKALKSFEMSVSSLDVTAPQTEKLHCSTVLLRLWQSQDACPCPVSHHNMHGVYCNSTLLVTQYGRICVLEVVLYVTTCFCLHSVYRCRESRDFVSVT